MIKSFAKPNRSIDLIGLVVKTAHIKCRSYIQDVAKLSQLLQKYHTFIWNGSKLYEIGCNCLLSENNYY